MYQSLSQDDNARWERAITGEDAGRRKVEGEFLLMCLTHNIGKIVSKIQPIAEQDKVYYRLTIAVAG